MRLGSRLKVGLAVLMIGLLVFVACGGQPQTGGDTSTSGEALLQARCTGCHALDVVTGASKTEAEWLSTVERMIEKGASLNAAEKETLVSYLAEMYGP
jgi:mono/diheme cytochrome c family protein